MKYVNKTVTLIIIFIVFILLILIPEKWQGTYIAGSISLLSLLAAILVYKYKCVQLIAGIDNNKGNDVDKQSKYGGILLFTIFCMSFIALLLTIFSKELSESLFMIILIIPIIIAIPFCIYKMNQK